MDKASIIAIEEVCKRCPQYTKYCGLSEYPSQCVTSGHFIDGYRKAEEDTIERMVEWLKVHAKNYIVNMTDSYPDAPFDAIIGGECWDELKKVMDEDNG